MGKHHFILKHNSKSYKAYFDDEDGEVTVLDSHGQPRTILQYMKKNVDLDDAKETAIEIVKKFRL